MFLPEGIAGGKGIAYSHGGRARVSLENYENINAILRNSATGSWMAAGDFGLKITQ
jgi:hypothetical protein